MRKTLKYGLAGLAIILIAGFTVVTLSIDYLVKTGIEEVGSEMMQTSVTVESVSISPFSGSGSIQGIRVDNPEGFEADHAIVLNNFSISMNVSSVLSDTIRINEITISEPAISVIQKVPENNLNMLMNNMEEAMASGSSSSTVMIIGRLLVENGQVSVTPSIASEKSATVKMGTIELSNIGKQGNSTSRQVVKLVMERIVNEALQTALSGELDNLKKKAKDAVEDIFN